VLCRLVVNLAVRSGEAYEQRNTTFELPNVDFAVNHRRRRVTQLTRSSRIRHARLRASSMNDDLPAPRARTGALASVEPDNFNRPNARRDNAEKIADRRRIPVR
jgi:hypothetical protein